MFKPNKVKKVTSWRDELGKNVKGLRKSCGLSLAELARQLGWNVSTVIDLEVGLLTPSAGQQADLARWTQAAKPRR